MTENERAAREFLGCLHDLSVACGCDCTPSCDALAFLLAAAEERGAERVRARAEAAERERDEARATATSIMGALEELPHRPDVGVHYWHYESALPYWEPDSPLSEPKRVVVEPRRVEGIFQSIREHAKTMLPFAWRAIQDHYRMESVEHHRKAAERRAADMEGVLRRTRDRMEANPSLEDILRIATDIDAALGGKG